MAETKTAFYTKLNTQKKILTTVATDPFYRNTSIDKFVKQLFDVINSAYKNNIISQAEFDSITSDTNNFIDSLLPIE